MPGHALYYSPAHLTDIRQGYLKDQKKALESLSFLGQLTKNKCIVKYAHQDEVRFETRDPMDFFFTNPDNDEGFFQNNDEKFSLSELIQSSGIYDRYKSMPVDFDAAEPVLAKLGVNFTRTKTDPTAYSLLLDFAEFLPNIIQEGHVFFKAMRETAKAKTGLSDKFGNNLDPIEVMASLLPETSFGQHFTEVMKESFEQDTDNRRDRISHLYMDLDLLGYKSDKLSDSHGFVNLIADTDHCYYASYCDVYVTNDKKAAAKAKAVMSHLKFTVKVFDLSEFADWIKHDSNTPAKC